MQGEAVLPISIILGKCGLVLHNVSHFFLYIRFTGKLFGESGNDPFLLWEALKRLTVLDTLVPR